MIRGRNRWAILAVVVGVVIAVGQLHGLGTTLSPYVYRDVANLTVTQSASPDPVTTGQKLTYVITAGNTGPDRATKVLIKDEVPPIVSFLSCTPPNGTTCTLTGDTLTVPLDSIGVDKKAKVTIVVKVKEAAFNDGALGNIATVSSLKVYDPDLGDNFASATVTSTHPCNDSWFGQSSPAIGTSAAMRGVAAATGDDVWAVGTTAFTSPPYNRTLATHWDGTTWTQKPTQDPSSFYDQLSGVTMIASTDVWAVGADGYNFGHYYPHYTLAEHWDGSKWTVIQSPSPSIHVNEFRAVSGVSPSDVWAVGDTSADSGLLQPLIEHWNGNKWASVSAPTVQGLDTILYGVWARAAGDAWAVGSATSRSTPPRMVIERWNGTKWKLASTPYVTPGRKVLSAVSGTAGDDVWATGHTVGSTGEETLVLHWGGNAWTRTASPNVGRHSALAGVSADMASDAWAVGFSGSASTESLVEHWNGQKWSIVTAPSVYVQPQPGLYDKVPDALAAVTAGSESWVWSVGSAGQTFGKDAATLSEREC